MREEAMDAFEADENAEESEMEAAAQEEFELCRDIQMKLPDVLWQLDYAGRYAAGKFNEDFASLDSGECFLFGVIEIPFLEEPGSFTWGVWAEVSREDHDAYLRDFQTARCEGRVIEGTLANDIPGYPEAFGSRASLTLHAGRRPEIRAEEGMLAGVQQQGMTLAEHQRIDLELFPEGYADDDEEEGSNG